MTLTHGADVDVLRSVAGQLDDSSRRITSVESTGAALSSTLQGSWAGDDLERFVAGWDSSRQQLHGCAERLTRFARLLGEQADQQDDGSNGGGSAPAGAGPGSRAPEGVDADNNDSRDRPRKHFFDTPKPPEYYENHEDPGPGNVEMPEGADPDDPAIQEMLKTANGRAALDWMARNDITITYDDKYDGAYYTASNNSMTLGKGGYRDASTIIHEANHARWDAEDRQVDVEETTREEYINGKYDEETDCVTNEVYYAKQAREAGVDAEYSVGEQKYDEGYARAYNSALEDGKTPAQAHQAGDAAGRKEIRHLFSSGYFKASGSGGKTYGELKGDYWDKQNDWNPFNGI